MIRNTRHNGSIYCIELVHDFVQRYDAASFFYPSEKSPNKTQLNVSPLDGPTHIPRSFAERSRSTKKKKVIDRIYLFFESPWMRTYKSMLVDFFESHQLTKMYRQRGRNLFLYLGGKGTIGTQKFFQASVEMTMCQCAPSSNSAISKAVDSASAARAGAKNCR